MPVEVELSELAMTAMKALFRLKEQSVMPGLTEQP